MSKGRDPHAEPADDRARYEQRLMRIGRRLQSLGQVLEQAPAHIVAKGFKSDVSITGERPVQIEMDEFKALFDETNDENVGTVLRAYHEVLLAQRKGEI